MSDSGSKGGRPDPARRDLSPTEYEAETFIGYSSPKRGPAADDATQPPASNLPPAEPGRPGAWGAPAPAQTEPAKAPEPNEDDDTGAIASDAVRTERDKSSGSLVDSWDHTPESGSGSVGNTGGGDPNTAATVAPRPRPSSSNFTNEGIKQSGRIGPYPIQGELGRGGMGVVYLAKDTRLNRDVAVKLLPDVFAEHADRAARFEREARLLATLNHPNIAAIYGLEEDGGHRFIVMEYIPGETLGDRIRNGPMPVDDALSVHAQIAEGLEAAHEKGVIHRDLKPGNVKITPDGVVKVLDFGLAKSSGPDAEEKEFNAPTGSLDNTQEGMILGTAGYMSPEQSRGRPLDKRTDVWSFGCVLYESLVGHPPFYADTVSDTIALILRTEPDWTALPADTPPRVVELLKRCFQKDPKRRLRDLGDARIELTDAHEAMSSIEVPAESVAAVREAEIAERRQQAVATVPWLVAGVSIAAAATSLALLFRGAPAVTAVAGTGNEVRFVSELAGLTVDFADGEGTAIAAGPDGSTFVVVGDAQGERQLYRRDLAEGDSFVPIQGTTDAT
ncbi:MAG: protein kinase, partial [Planctomycetota bacterium]